VTGEEMCLPQQLTEDANGNPETPKTKTKKITNIKMKQNYDFC
jgi:hypothetical protein